MPATLVTGIGELVTNDPNAGRGILGIVEQAAVAFDDGRIAWVGAADGAPACDTRIDVAGRAALPGWVDSHTHLVFAGDRADEFSARMAGQSYSAGGMNATVSATRAASDSTLADLTTMRLAAMRRAGTTCVEIKTGYGLSVADEQRCASIAADAGADEVTFLGAHVIPAGYDAANAESRREYLDLVTGPMLAAVKRAAGWIDVFCEQGAFDEPETRRVLAAGRDAGLGLRVHGNQLSYNAGAQIAVDMGAASVDHCTYLTGADIDALAASDTVATILPMADLSTRQPPAPARRLIDAGATVALASNCNPGTSYSSQMTLVVALAVIQCELSAAEAIRAATKGGADALRRTDVGALTVGSRADLQVLDAPSVDHIAYRVGNIDTYAVWQRGVRVC